MRKTTTFFMIAVMALMLLSGIAGAQSTYLPDPTPPSIPGLPVDPPPLPDLPGVPPECTRIGMLDKYEIILNVGGPSETITATIPSELEPYEVSWVSEDTSVATVTAQSAATVAPVGVGECLVYIFVTTDDETYCDFALVRVLAEDEEPTPTPPTGGATYTSIFAGIFLISAALLVKRKLLLSS